MFDKNETIQYVPEHIVDQSLESKRNNQVLMMSTCSVESCLPLVSFTYLHKMVGIPKVQFGEDSSPLERFES
jgi:hypothetical protein